MHAVLFAALYLWAPATKTVCSSGCDFTTINAAEVAALCGDTIQIKAGLGGGTGSNGTPTGFHCGGGGSCNTNNPVVLTHACTVGNEITITTDQSSRLPGTGVRITPAYVNGSSPVVPTIYNPGPGIALYAKLGNGGAPASGYKLIGLDICCFSSSSDFVPLGSRAQGTADSQLNVVGDIPTNITLDRVLVRTDPTQNTRKCITYDAIGLDIKNSHIDCAYDTNSSDSQGISAFMGQGHIFNSYIAGATESLSTGGAMPPVLTPIVGGVKADNWTILTTQIPGPIEVAWNEITKPKWIYAVGVNWTANTLITKGQLMHSVAGTTTPLMQAQNTGTTGNSEPTWPSLNGTVVDGGVTWKRTDVTDQAKNLFECKSCTTINLHHNFFHRAWPQGQQGYAFTLTSSPSYAGAQTVDHTTIQNNYIRDVGTILNDSGQDCSNDLNCIPSIMTGIGPWNITSSVNQLSFTINGTAASVTLTTGAAQTAANVQADLVRAFTTAGVGLACLDNLGAVVIRGRSAGDTATCGGLAVNETLDSSHFIRVNSTANDAWATLTATLTPGTAAPIEGTQYSGCIDPRSLSFYGCGHFDTLLFDNNLARNVNTSQFYSGVGYLFAVFQHEQTLTFTHNTISALFGQANVNGGNLQTTFDAEPSVPNGGPIKGFAPFNVLTLNNIIGWTGSPSGVGYVNNGTNTDFTGLNYFWCQPSLVNSVSDTPSDSVCPPNVFAGNVLPAALLAATPTLTTSIVNNGGPGIFRYPSNNFNVSTASLNLDPNTFAVGTSPGNGTDGKVPGADTTQIPRILNPTIAVTSTQATLSYNVTAPITTSGYSCITSVTDKPPEFYNAQVGYDTANAARPIADQDPSQFVNPGVVANPSSTSQSITFGLNAPLTPATTYYLSLMCPGATWPEDGTSMPFTTTATAGQSSSALFGSVTQAGPVTKF